MSFDWSPINLAKIPSGWTDKRIETLKELWAQGLSGSAIAAELGEVTRNSVIGKVHRLGLAKRANPTNARATPTPFRKPRVQRFREVLNTGAVLVWPLIRSGEGDPSVMPDQRRPGSHSCTLMDLSSATCRWPLWTDAMPERLYCGADGADMENKRSYCPFHSRMAYRARAA